MTLFGLLWAMLAPLSLVLAAAALAMLFKRTGLPRWGALALAAALVVGPVAYLWRQDRAGFDALCRAEGTARIIEKAQADGFLLVSGTATSFGMRYLHDEGFAWIETRDIYRREGFMRYTRNDKGEISSTPIDAPSARYEVRETYEEPAPTISLSHTLIIDRQTNKELARAGSAHFLGGRMRWLLGAWGVGSCPNASTHSADFNAWYHLARNTLR